MKKIPHIPKFENVPEKLVTEPDDFDKIVNTYMSEIIRGLNYDRT